MFVDDFVYVWSVGFVGASVRSTQDPSGLSHRASVPKLSLPALNMELPTLYTQVTQTVGDSSRFGQVAHVRQNQNKAQSKLKRDLYSGDISRLRLTSTRVILRSKAAKKTDICGYSG